MPIERVEQESNLLIATARARNTGAVLRVVDESVRRAAELREEREARRAEERAAEARRDRAETAERIEREHAERLSDQYRAEAARVVEDRAEAEALLREGEEQARLQSGDAIDLFA